MTFTVETPALMTCLYELQQFLHSPKPPFFLLSYQTLIYFFLDY